jgi:hypothetical protein
MLDQVVIAACGVTTVYLSQDHRAGARKWACIVGMVAQPFWLYAAWTAEQWGIFLLSIVYFAGWARGFRNFWLRKPAA